MLSIKSRPFDKVRSGFQAIVNTNCELFIKRIFVAFLSIATVSCSINPITEQVNDPLVDQSFITAEPCTAPCWYGLELDKSSTNDITAMLKSLPFIDPTSIRQATSPWLNDDDAIVITWDCLHPQLKGCGVAKVSKDKLKDLWMKVGYRLDFQTVIATLGLPDYVDYGYQDPAAGCLVFMDWPERGISVLSDGNGDSLCQSIEKGTKIPPNTLATKLVYVVTSGFGPEPSVCCRRIAWPGFAQP